MSPQDMHFLKTIQFLRRKSWHVKNSWQETAPYYGIPQARIYNFGSQQDTRCSGHPVLEIGCELCQELIRISADQHCS